MMTANHHPSSNGWIASTAIAACIVLAIALLAMTPQPARALPPRPTVEPTPGTTGRASSSWAQIQLQVQFSQNWPWQTTHWQDLWTGVQWRDAQGAWHDVAGWQGTLDEVKDGGSEGVTGYKTWWLGAEHMGQGPFRWQVYQSQGGSLLATSESFDLPGVDRALLTVEVTLAR